MPVLHVGDMMMVIIVVLMVLKMNKNIETPDCYLGAGNIAHTEMMMLLLLMSLLLEW